MMSGNAGANDTLQSTPSIVGLGKGHRPSLAFSVTVIGGRGRGVLPVSAERQPEAEVVGCNTDYTDRSKLIAARLRIDAVQQRTSNAIHVSQTASPRPH